MNLRTNEPSNQWAFGTMDLRNEPSNGPIESMDLPINGPSDQCTFEPMDLLTNGPSNQWTFGTIYLRNNEPSDQWTFRPMNLRTKNLRKRRDSSLILSPKTFIIITCFLNLVSISIYFFHVYFIVILTMLYTLPKCIMDANLLIEKT